MEQTAGFLEDVQNSLLQSTSVGAKVSGFRVMQQKILSLLFYVSVDPPIRNLPLLLHDVQYIYRKAPGSV